MCKDNKLTYIIVGMECIFTFQADQVQEIKQDMDCIMQVSEEDLEISTIEDQNVAIKHLKPGKAAGGDGTNTDVVYTEGKTQLLSLFNKCIILSNLKDMEMSEIHQ